MALIRHLLVPVLIGTLAGLTVVLVFFMSGSHKPATQPGYATAVEIASPAVVNIYSTKLGLPRICEQPRFREWCNRFDGRERNHMQSSLGSGVVVHSDGFIVTNNHVIEDADEILVMFADGRTSQAVLVGRDPQTDLAVIRVPLTGLTPIVLGSSDEVAVGDVVLAIGNPFGIGQTVSAGIISAKGRAGVSASPYDDFIQTDAAINPGNSGGALIDTEGRLIGINTMIFSRSGDSIGVGFAIPAQLTYTILEEIIETGRVTRGWLGVVLDNSPSNDDQPGLKIADVERGGPAARAGLNAHDIVLTINDQPALDPNVFSREVGQTEPGDQIQLRILRQGRQFEVRVVAGERQDRP